MDQGNDTGETRTDLTDGQGNEESAALPRGASIGRYLVVETLGSGGFGQVYRGYDPELNRPVAIKLVKNKAHGQELQTRLLREAQALAQLSHPNVIAVHDVGLLGTDVFIAMELVEGVTLRSWMKEPHALAEILEVMIAAGRGLEAAHARGLVHRDFKPDNLIIGGDGRVRVIDFGLACLSEKGRREGPPSGEVTASAPDREPHSGAVSTAPASGGRLDSASGSLPAEEGPGSGSGTSSPKRQSLLSDPLTQVGKVMGTLAYMSPEQLLATELDPRSDQFAFCVTLHEALFGKRPFSGRNRAKLLRAITQGQIDEPGRKRAVPKRLRLALRKGLSAAMQDRHASMAELLSVMAEDPARARRRLAFAGGLAVFLLLAAWLTYRQWSQEREACRQGGTKLSEIWSAGPKGQIRTAFLATGRAYAPYSFTVVEKLLDDYGLSWARAHDEACAATWLRKEQSAELFDLRMLCLSMRREGLRSLVSRLARADESVVQKSVEAAMGLAPLAECDDVSSLRQGPSLPRDPAVRGRIEAARKLIEEAGVSERLGKLEEGIAQVGAAARSSEDVPYLPLKAEVGWTLGRLEMARGKYPEAKSALYAAWFAAESSAQDELKARIVASLILAVGGYLEQYAESDQLARHAEAILGRLPRPDLPRLEWHTAIANVELNRLALDKSLSHLQEARALVEAQFGPEHFRTALVENQIGQVYERRRENRKSLAHFEAARVIVEKLLGPDHPRVGFALNNIASGLANQGEFDRALVLMERAREIVSRALGAGHPTVGTILYNQGYLNKNAGRADKAIPYLEEALRIQEKAFGADHPQVARTLQNLGSARRLLGQRDQAERLLARALSIFEKTYGPENYQVASGLLSCARNRLDLGQASQSAALIERAQAICKKVECDPELPPDLDYNLAKALYAQGGPANRARSKQLVERALGQKDKVQGDPSWLPEVEAWARKAFPAN